MVSIGRLPSGRWQARTRVNGRQVKRSFDRRRQAEDWLAETRVDTARGIHLDEKAGRQLVGDYVRTWLKGRPHRASTAERQRSLLRNHVIETHLGRMRLVDVKPSDVQTWATGRSRVLAPSTLRVLRSLVGAIFSAAVLDRAIPVSPVTRVTLPRHDKPRVVPLRVDQVRALEAALPPRYRALVVAQAGLGLRISELLGLRPEDVDWLGRVVRVRVQLGRDGSFQPLKTASSERDVPMPTFVAEALSRHVTEFPPARTLFTAEKGGPVRRDWYGTRVFQKAVKAAGLPEGTTPHDLRHHYASVLIAAGASVVAVAQRLGHENAGMVIRVYGHLVEGQDDHTRRALDAAWCAPDVPAAGETVR
jgi:integrase